MSESLEEPIEFAKRHLRVMLNERPDVAEVSIRVVLKTGHSLILTSDRTGETQHMSVGFPPPAPFYHPDWRL